MTKHTSVDNTVAMKIASYKKKITFACRTIEQIKHNSEGFQKH